MNSRIRGLLILVFAIILVLIGRLAQLQLVDYVSYATESRDNYIKTAAIPAPRGRIFDRSGLPIAENRYAVDLEYKGGPVLFAGRILGLLKLRRFPPVKGKPVVVATNIPDELVPTLAELTAGQKNLVLRRRIERYYPHPISGPVLGFVQLANVQDLKNGYLPDDVVGKSGLEAAYQDQLRGRPGLRSVEVNALGETVREKVLREPVPGKDLYLTIDYPLQMAAQKALSESVRWVNAWRKTHDFPPDVKVVRGAVVAIDPKSGAVLAMASVPGYDPNLFTQQPVPFDISKILSDPLHPMLDRAVSAYPPGSTFKPVTSSALLESGVVSPSTIFDCKTAIIYGGVVRRNWAKKDMGPMNIEQAIAHSCNTWFYQAVIKGQPTKLVDPIADRAKALGIGRPTGLALPQQNGFLPTLKNNRQLTNQPWYPGNTLSVAIGQGQVLATPVQMARMLATIIENGHQPTLHLVEKIGDTPVVPPVTRVPGSYYAVLRRGLRLATTEGTAKLDFQKFTVPTGGKTGTAQVPGPHAPDSWYIGYGPLKPSPKYPPLVVVAFVENGGDGSWVAMPIAKAVMAAYWHVPANLPNW